MISSLELEYFKCFKNVKVPFAPLTLISGLNSSGKSSILQSLALLNQTFLDDRSNDRLLLEGRNVSLGTAGSIVNDIYGRNEIGIKIETKDDKFIHWKFDIPDEKNKPFFQLKEAHSNNIQYRYKSNDLLSYLLPIEKYKDDSNILEKLRNLFFLSAERIGPREVYSYPTTSTKTIGSMGEYTPWYLHEFGNEKISTKIQKKEYDNKLIRQVEGWMNDFFPGFEMQINVVNDANVVTMGIRTNRTSRFHRPQNVGFGITHLLPIITACIGQKEKNVVLIQNPESHLHPEGQSMVGYFLAIIASAGIQVIFETHSDHVLNGVRKALKQEKIKAQDVLFYFFQTNEEGNAEITNPSVDQKGNLDFWPEGFFDQFDKDLEYFTDWGE